MLCFVFVPIYYTILEAYLDDEDKYKYKAGCVDVYSIILDITLEYEVCVE